MAENICRTNQNFPKLHSPHLKFNGKWAGAELARMAREKVQREEVDEEGNALESRRILVFLSLVPSYSVDF